MISINFIIGILLIHLIGDFFLQSRYIAENKSENIGVLIAHITIYTLSLYVGLFIYILIFKDYNMITTLMLYASINGILHFIVDFITSKINSKLYKQGKIYWFFVTIGCDQTIHFIILFWTYNFLINYNFN